MEEQQICDIMDRMFLCDSVNCHHSFIYVFSDFVNVTQSQ